jgi:hypothetical protein
MLIIVNISSAVIDIEACYIPMKSTDTGIVDNSTS